ncbi:MAG: hypothetical protein M3Y81_05790 [Chloroflexota bacterium]|nr:hypothetical protein [Chloroflexota bacterium]
MNLHEMSPTKLQEVRKTALAIVERTKVDEEFRAHVQQAPVDTLIEAGLPREAVGEFLRETQLVEGFNADDVSGFGYICIVTVK